MAKCSKEPTTAGARPSRLMRAAPSGQSPRMREGHRPTIRDRNGGQEARCYRSCRYDICAVTRRQAALESSVTLRAHRWRYRRERCYESVPHLLIVESHLSPHTAVPTFTDSFSFFNEAGAPSAPCHPIAHHGPRPLPNELLHTRWAVTLNPPTPHRRFPATQSR